MSSTTTSQTTTMPVALPVTNNPGHKLIESMEKYTLTDIGMLEAIALENEQKDKQREPSDPSFGTGRCTTALAGLCFATIEQIGLIVSNLNPATIANDIKFGNSKNAVSFFSFFSNNGLSAVSQAEIEAVYYLFRNKITHNLFPKHALGVCQNEANPLDNLVIAINGTFSLNVNFLSNYIKKAIPILKGLLSSDPALATMVDDNVKLIDGAETTDMHQKYANKPDWQSYFTRWLPGVTF